MSSFTTTLKTVENKEAANPLKANGKSTSEEVYHITVSIKLWYFPLASKISMHNLYSTSSKLIEQEENSAKQAVLCKTWDMCHKK